MNDRISRSTLHRREIALLAAVVVFVVFGAGACSAETKAVTVHYVGDPGGSNGFTMDVPADWEIVVPDPPPAGLNDGESIAVLALYPPDSGEAVVAVMRPVAPENAEAEAAVWSGRGEHYAAFEERRVGNSRILTSAADVQTPGDGKTQIAVAIVELPGMVVWSMACGPARDAEDLCLRVAGWLGSYAPGSR